MEIFSDGRQRSGYEEIVASGPKWWTEYREMDAVYRYEGWLLDLMLHFLEQKVKNQFPSQADEKTIAMYERLLRIENDAWVALDERRKVVSAYYSGTGHLSRSVIQQMIKSYTGCDSEIAWDGTVFQISITGEDGPQLINEKILRFVSRRMPGHIAYSVSAEETTVQEVHIGAVHYMMPNLVIQCERLNYVPIKEYVGIRHVTVQRMILA